MFQNIIRAVTVAGAIAFAFSVWWGKPATRYQTRHFPDMTAQTEVDIHVGQIDYCEIATHWGAISKSGRLIHRWLPDFGPCYLLDRYENV